MTYLQLPQQTQLTSRAALSQEDGLTGILLSHHRQELDLEVQRLHDVVRHSLGDFAVCAKRRKLDNAPMEADIDATDIPFRLISWSLPPRLIHLVPARQSNVRYQRPAEDTVGEARLRKMRAQETAVDAESILTHALMPNPKATSTTDTLTHVVTGTNPLQLPNLLVTKPHPSGNLSAPQGDEIQTEHGHVRCCPLVPLTDKSLCNKIKRKRKRRRYSSSDRPPSTFFRPMQEWGGKSAGYAMGWQGSRPAKPFESRQYARDKMRKGTLGGLPDNVTR